MKIILASAIILLGPVLALGPACAQNATVGRQIAEQWCSACHQIEPAPKTDSDKIPPSFASVAAMSSTTALSLHAFLSNPHGRMPDFALTRAEIRDVSAYILSLKSN